MTRNKKGVYQCSISLYTSLKIYRNFAKIAKKIWWPKIGLSLREICISCTSLKQVLLPSIFPKTWSNIGVCVRNWSSCDTYIEHQNSGYNKHLLSTTVTLLASEKSRRRCSVLSHFPLIFCGSFQDPYANIRSTRPRKKSSLSNPFWNNREHKNFHSLFSMSFLILHTSEWKYAKAE